MMSQQLEDELRTAFTTFGTELAVPDEVHRRLAEHRYHPGRPSPGRIATAGGVVGIAAAASVFALLPSTSQPTAPKAAITLDAYRFQLPAGYLPKPTRPCFYVYRTPIPLRAGSHISPIRYPGNERRYVSAAAADGGCITVEISAPYRPKPGKPDPSALPGSKPVRVGHHHGFVTRYTFAFKFRHHRTRILVQDLNVQINVTHGRKRDFVFEATKLPLRTVIKIAKSGLG